MRSRFLMLTLFAILLTSLSVLAYMAHEEEACTAYCIDRPEELIEEPTPARMIWENLPAPVQTCLTFKF